MVVIPWSCLFSGRVCVFSTKIMHSQEGFLWRHQQFRNLKCNLFLNFWRVGGLWNNSCEKCSALNLICFLFTTPETVYFWGRLTFGRGPKIPLKNSGHIWDTFETLGARYLCMIITSRKRLCFCLMSRRFRKCECPTLHHGGCCQIASARLKKGKRIRIFRRINLLYIGSH